MKEENKLNQEFWNKLAEKYPAEITDLRKWIDEYKKRVDWNDLFWNAGQQRIVYWSDIKFHHLPDMMQAGLFIQYIIETKGSHRYSLVFDTVNGHHIEKWVEQWILGKPLPDREWISVDAGRPEGGKSVLVKWNGISREAYYNAGFNTWHIRSTMPNEQEDIQIYPTQWREMPK